MKKLKWQRKYLYNGRTPHTLFPHDYSSNSNLWIQNRSFKVPKNGWELYDNDTFNTRHAAEIALQKLLQKEVKKR